MCKKNLQKAPFWAVFRVFMGSKCMGRYSNFTFRPSQEVRTHAYHGPHTQITIVCKKKPKKGLFLGNFPCLYRLSMGSFAETFQFCTKSIIRSPHICILMTFHLKNL